MEEEGGMKVITITTATVNLAGSLSESKCLVVGHHKNLSFHELK